MNIKLTKSDLYLIGLFFLIAIPVTFSGYDYSQGLFEPVLDTLIYCVFALALTYVIVYKLFPIYFPKKQIVRLFLWTVPILMIAGMIEVIMYELVEQGFLSSFDAFSKINWLKVIGNFKKPELLAWGIISSSENAGILIGMLLGKKFYDSQLSLQEKEKEKKESELRLLKSQMDPHFLFNNLNTIDSLIDSKPEVAKIYLNKLSQLYRYLIRTKDDEVVPLEEEITFAKNYIYLLEQRYGSAYVFEIIPNANIGDKLIPPGALQTLLENVVKHNEGQTVDPISTKIIIEEKEIKITNNLKLKKAKQDSYGIGLSNLKARYKQLSDEPIRITTDDHYSVSLPNLLALS